MSRAYGTGRRTTPDDGLDVVRGVMVALGFYAALFLVWVVVR